jgi:hypothetical protein
VCVACCRDPLGDIKQFVDDVFAVKKNVILACNFVGSDSCVRVSCSHQALKMTDTAVGSLSG